MRNLVTDEVIYYLIHKGGIVTYSAFTMCAVCLSCLCCVMNTIDKLHVCVVHNNMMYMCSVGCTQEAIDLT